jgi:hypothetical protein
LAARINDKQGKSRVDAEIAHSKKSNRQRLAKATFVALMTVRKALLSAATLYNVD